MRALRLLSPARASLRSLSTRISSPCTSTTSKPNLPSSPILHRLSHQRPFSKTSHRRNDWRDPRHRDQHEQLSRAKPLFTQESLSRFLRSPSLRTVVVLSVGGALAFYFLNLETVPVSGRRRFNFYSEAKVEAASAAQVKRLEWEVERSGHQFLPEWDWRVRLVTRVLRRLIPVSGMEDSAWEIRVIDDPRTANAFVLPGGKVYVFSGLIPIARNEHGLAAVLGHEIAHNLAEHVGERMSSQVGVNMLLWSLIFLTGGIAILGTSFFGGYVLDVLFSRPMGRRQESEADYIGLMMMAEACYDPREALGFWRRMEKMHDGNEPPEWMSTHPSNNNRIQKIQEWMPKALEKLQESDCQGTSGFADLFRQALRRGALFEKQDSI